MLVEVTASCSDNYKRGQVRKAKVLCYMQHRTYMLCESSGHALHDSSGSREHNLVKYNASSRRRPTIDSCWSVNQVDSGCIISLDV